MTDSVYFAWGRTIIAMDRQNGRETWRTELQGGVAIRMLLVQGKEIFVATTHGVRCVDRFTGALLWQQDHPPLIGVPVHIGVSGTDQQVSGAADAEPS